MFFYGHLFRMEVVGRYPTIEEEVEFRVLGDVPVWLPTKPTFPQYSEEIRNVLTFLRQANILLSVLNFILICFICFDMLYFSTWMKGGYRETE